MKPSIYIKNHLLSDINITVSHLWINLPDSRHLEWKQFRWRKHCRTCTTQ